MYFSYSLLGFTNFKSGYLLHFYYIFNLQEANASQIWYLIFFEL